MVPILKKEDTEALRERLSARARMGSPEVAARVREIVENVRREGDRALFAYTEQLDHVRLDASSVQVTEAEIDLAMKEADPEWIRAMEEAAGRIRVFHEKQRQNSWLDFQDGITLGQKISPLRRVGLYVPGGTAAYPSSVLMNVIPARVAGVRDIIMVTPPGRDGNVSYPLVLAAARIAGVDRIFKAGGAQAIAAMAFGTQSIPRVDKITGPGNIYVAMAKREVFGHVGIDMVAGPSEVLVVADSGARPDWVAADLLSQAEHDPLAAAILVTDSEDMARSVDAELDKQTSVLPRREVAEKSLASYGTLIVCRDLQDCADMVNEFAPEHCELCVTDPWSMLEKIDCAGAVFMGHWSPEPLGDYMAGPNHVLPTSGTARFFSPLSVDDFVHKSSVIFCSEKELRKVGGQVVRLARSEGLDAHARAVCIRFDQEGGK